MKKLVLLAALAAALLVGAATFASAETATYGSAVPGTVTVKATVNQKLAMSITTTDAVSQTVDFGTVDPGSSYAGKTAVLNVKANKGYKLDKAIGGQFALMGLSTSLPVTATLAKPAAAGDDYTDDYSLNVPWDTAPAAYTATVQYTATLQ